MPRIQFNVYQIPAQEVEIKKNQIRGLIQTYNLSEQEFVDETVPCLHGTHKLNMHEISNTIAENYKRVHAWENFLVKCDAGNQGAIGGR